MNEWYQGYQQEPLHTTTYNRSTTSIRTAHFLIASGYFLAILGRFLGYIPLLDIAYALIGSGYVLAAIRS
jgi:hypothetical protein